MADDTGKGGSRAFRRLLSPAEERSAMERIMDGLRRNDTGELTEVSAAAKKAIRDGHRDTARQLVGILLAVRDLRVGSGGVRNTLDEIEGLWPQ